ncbi:hypothetical protein LCGC14_2477360, partial [marine sediment metagenome]
MKYRIKELESVQNIEKKLKLILN